MDPFLTNFTDFKFRKGKIRNQKTYKSRRERDSNPRGALAPIRFRVGAVMATSVSLPHELAQSNQMKKIVNLNPPIVTIIFRK